MSVLGFDLSLTSTGVASRDRTWRFKPRPVPQRAPVVERLTRQRQLRMLLRDLMETVCPSLVVVEGPSHGSTGGPEHERGGFWWSVADLVDAFGADLLVATPTTSRSTPPAAATPTKTRC